MGYTVDQANEELKKIINGERPATKEELKKIIANLDVSDNFANADAKTVLYSGYNVENLENNRNIRLLNHTEAYEFLNNITRNEKFKDAWIKITGEVIDETDFENYNSEVGKFIGGVDGNPRVEGAWDTVSRNFAEATEGEVIVFAGKRDDRNNTVKPINNIAFKKEEAA